MLLRVIQAQVGVLHPLLGATGVIGSEQFGQSKIVAPFAEFVIQARLVRGDNRNSVERGAGELFALRIRQASDVRENQRLKICEMSGIEQTVMDHFEWNARFDQGL